MMKQNTDASRNLKMSKKTNKKLFSELSIFFWLKFGAKRHFSPLRNQRFLKGFTLVELFVVIFIMVLMLGIILPNYVARNKEMNLERSANLLAQFLRKAVEKTMSAAEVGPANGKIIPEGGYGLYFEIGSPDTIILFADCKIDGNPPNRSYDSTGDVCGQPGFKFPEEVERIELEKEVKIESLVPTSAPNTLNITFQSPDPTVFIAGSETMFSQAEITLIAGSQRRIIIINKAGLVEVKRGP